MQGHRPAKAYGFSIDLTVYVLCGLFLRIKNGYLVSLFFQIAFQIREIKAHCISPSFLSMHIVYNAFFAGISLL